MATDQRNRKSHSPKRLDSARGTKGSEGRAGQKKITVTLALDENLLREIRKEAEHDKTSLNAKANSIFERYVSFSKYHESLGAVIIPQTQFLQLLELMDEARLTEIMKTSGNSNVLAMFNLLGVPADLNSLNKYCFSKYIRWSGAYNSFNSYIDKEGYPCLVFEHKFGLKWSRVMAEALSESINLTLGYPTEKKIMPSTIVLRVMERGLKLDEG